MGERIKHAVPVVKEVTENLYAILLYVMDSLSEIAMAIPTVIFSARALASIMQIEMLLAYIAAAGIEVTGQSIVNRWMSAAEWNRTKRKSDPRAMSGMLGVFVAIYFILDFLVIGLVQIPALIAGEYERVVVLAFPIMQVINVVSASEKVRQTERVMRREKQRTERRKTKPKREKHVYQLDEQEKQIVKLFKEDPEMTYRDMAEQIDRSIGWISGRVRKLSDQGILKRNGKGVEIC